MKYVKQLLIIILISFMGELLNYIIPLPIPGSIYGMLLMFILLCSGILKLEQVKKTGKFLLDIMPIMFIPSLAGLVENAETIRTMLLPLLVICIVTTLIVAAVSGLATEQLLKRKEKKGTGHE